MMDTHRIVGMVAVLSGTLFLWVVVSIHHWPLIVSDLGYGNDSFLARLLAIYWYFLALTKVFP